MLLGDGSWDAILLLKAILLYVEPRAVKKVGRPTRSLKTWIYAQGSIAISLDPSAIERSRTESRRWGVDTAHTLSGSVDFPLR